MKKNLSTTHKFLILSIVLAVVAVSLFGYMLVTLSRIQEKRSLVIGGQEEATIAYSPDELRASRNLSQYFVSGGDEAFFISSLESLCLSLSLSCSMRSLEEINQGSATSPIKLFRLTVDSVGNFDNNMKFLRSFEKSSYPIEIEMVNLVTDREGDSSEWTGTFNISVPVFFK